MTLENARLLAPDDYLHKHSLMVYVKDAVALLFDRKNDGGKTKPLEVLEEYFARVKSGTHVVFREYFYVAATAYNRAYFLKLFWNTYVEIELREDRLKLEDYVSLLRLLCPDFPSTLVLEIPRSEENIAMAFSDFIYSFQVVFFYNAFLTRCRALYMDAQHTARSSQHTNGLCASSSDLGGPADTVSSSDLGGPADTVSSSDLGGPADTVSSSDMGEPADIVSFEKRLLCLAKELSDKEALRYCPSIKALEAVVTKGGLSYTAFVAELCRSEHVNLDISVLPCKVDFYQTCVTLKKTRML